MPGRMATRGCHWQASAGCRLAALGSAPGWLHASCRGCLRMAPTSAACGAAHVQPPPPPTPILAHASKSRMPLTPAVQPWRSFPPPRPSPAHLVILHPVCGQPLHQQHEGAPGRVGAQDLLPCLDPHEAGLLRGLQQRECVCVCEHACEGGIGGGWLRLRPGCSSRARDLIRKQQLDNPGIHRHTQGGTLFAHTKHPGPLRRRTHTIRPVLPLPRSRLSPPTPPACPCPSGDKRTATAGAGRRP